MEKKALREIRPFNINEAGKIHPEGIKVSNIYVIVWYQNKMSKN